MDALATICLKQGRLNKLGGQVKKWKCRLCKLQGGSLKYFRLPVGSESDSEVLGEIYLGAAKVELVPASVYNTKWLFGITPYGRKRMYVFGAQTEDECGEWLRLVAHIAASTPKSSEMEERDREKAEKAERSSTLTTSSQIEDTSGDPSKAIAENADSEESKEAAGAEEDEDKEDKEDGPGRQEGAFQYSESDSDRVSDDYSLDSESSDSGQEEKTDTGVSGGLSSKRMSVMPRAQATVKEGFLIKEGHNRKNWLRRFFVLTGHNLAYYSNHDCEDKLGEVHMIGTVWRPIPESECSKKFAFELEQTTGERRKYSLVASSQDDFNEWAAVLKARHRYDPKPMILKISLDEHPDIAMTMNPDDNQLQAMTVDGHGLGKANIGTKKSKGGLKSKVSKKKRRFVLDGFNLDLTYVTDRLIAMGFPSVGTEGLYRNGMADVQRFFNERHGGHYKIYNLCSERKYEPECFNGSVCLFPFDDHNVPCFQDMSFLNRELGAYLAKDPKNIAGIHCKAGKGRTGLVITCFLLYCGEWKTADEALRYYAFARTENQKGVTIPSQIRWVHYFQQYMDKSAAGTGLPSLERLVVSRIILSKKAPSWSEFTLNCHGLEVHSKEAKKINKMKEGTEIILGKPFVVTYTLYAQPHPTSSYLIQSHPSSTFLTFLT